MTNTIGASARMSNAFCRKIIAADDTAKISSVSAKSRIQLLYFIGTSSVTTLHYNTAALKMWQRM